MNARRAARELAILSFAQIEKNLEKWEDKPIEEIIVTSVRTIVSNAENNLRTTVGSLFEIREFIENYEMDHPENLKRSIDLSNIPVPIPLTSDMLGRIDSLIEVADRTFMALEAAEISSLSQKQDVKEFTFSLLKSYHNNKDLIDGNISKFSKGWNIERLVRIDRDILRLGITELLFVEDVPISVTIDEYVDLAKKYSTEESSSFINGILREVVTNSNLRKK